jgi:hypothetical protein
MGSIYDVNGIIEEVFFEILFDNPDLPPHPQSYIWLSNALTSSIGSTLFL